MEVRSTQEEGIALFEVNGEINITTSPELKRTFEKQPAKRVVIDLEKVSYIDSSGLATLVEILKRVKAQGGFLGLSGMSDKVKSLFEITKLDKLFLVYRSRSEAMTGIQAK